MFILVQFNNILAPAFHNMGIKGLMHYVCHAKGICLVIAVFNGFPGYQDYGDLINHPFFLHKLQHTKAVQHRHHNIHQYQHKIIAPGNLDSSFFSILSLKDFIFILKNPPEYRAVYFLIINNQYLLPVHKISLLFLI